MQCLNSDTALTPTRALTLWHPWRWRGLCFGVQETELCWNLRGESLHSETTHLWESGVGWGSGLREGLPLGLC